MSTLLVRVAVGEAQGAIPMQRIRRFAQAARRRWPAVAIQIREFKEGPSARWVGVLASTDSRSLDAENQFLSMEERLASFLEGNLAPFLRWTYFPADLSFDEVIQQLGG